MLYILIMINIITLLLIKHYNLYLTVSLSDSMYPTIKKGNILLVKGNVNKDKIKCRDIIVYTLKYLDIPVMHRVIGITEEGYETKGDNNTNKDKDTILKGNIKGKYLCNIGYNIKLEHIKEKTIKLNFLFYTLVIAIEWLIFVILTY